jgi:hypothetical protein
MREIDSDGHFHPHVTQKRTFAGLHRKAALSPVPFNFGFMNQYKRILPSLSRALAQPVGTLRQNENGRSIGVLLRLSFAFQRGYIDDKSIFNLSFDHPLVRFIDLLNWNHLHVRGDTVFSAVMEHFLGFLDTADH